MKKAPPTTSSSRSHRRKNASSAAVRSRKSPAKEKEKVISKVVRGFSEHEVKRCVSTFFLSFFFFFDTHVH